MRTDVGVPIGAGVQFICACCPVDCRALRSEARAPVWSNGLITMLVSSTALTAWTRPATPPLMGLYF